MKRSVTAALLIFLSAPLWAQVSLNTNQIAELNASFTANWYWGVPRQALASFPICSGNNTGGLRYDTGGNIVYYCNGSAWTAVGGATLGGNNTFTGSNSFTQQVTFAAGSLSTPSYTFTGAGTNSGMFASGAGSLDIVSGAQGVFHITGTTGIRIKGADTFGWSSGDASNTSVDTWFSRDHAGAIKFDSTAAIPTITAGCGTGAAITANSSDHFVQVNVGTTPGTSCTITFSAAYATAPMCFAQDTTQQAITTTCATTTTTVVLTTGTAWTNSSIINVMLQGF